MIEAHAAFLQHPNRPGLIEEVQNARLFHEMTGENLLFLRVGGKISAHYYPPHQSTAEPSDFTIEGLRVVHMNGVKLKGQLRRLARMIEELPPGAVINRSLPLPGALNLAEAKTLVEQPGLVATSRVYVANQEVIYSEELYADGQRTKGLRASSTQEEQAVLGVVETMADAMKVGRHALALSVKLAPQGNNLVPTHINARPRRYYYADRRAQRFAEAEITALVRAFRDHDNTATGLA
jgi:hypothetical protein